MTAQERIKRKRKRAHLLLMKAHLVKAKRTILETNFGVESLTELPEADLDTLINDIMHIIDGQQKNPDKEIRSWRHKCLRMIAACGINTQDWNEVNAFMMAPQIAGKHMYKMDLDELKWLHRKLQNVAPNMKAQRDDELEIANQN